MPHPADIDALILVLVQDGEAAQRARDELAALGEPAVRRLLEVIDGTASLAFPEGTYPQDLMDGLTGGLVASARGCVQVLVDAIAERPARGRSTSVLWALGALADPLAVPVLLDALRDRSWSARWAAAHGLGACGDAEVTPALAKAVSDRDSSVRGAAVGALARVGDLRAREALERAIVASQNAGSPGIVNGARAALAAIEARAGMGPATAGTQPAQPARGGGGRGERVGHRLPAALLFLLLARTSTTE